MSIEGSGKKGINYWPGKKAYETSSNKEDEENTAEKKQAVFSANAMEEYLKAKEKAAI